MSIGDLFYNPASSTNYDNALSQWLKQGSYGAFTDQSGDVGSGFASYTPQWNPFINTASGAGEGQFNISGDTFTPDNYDQFLRTRFDLPNTVTHDQLQTFFNSPQGIAATTSAAGGWKEDLQPFAQAVAKTIAMYFGGPAAVAGSIAAGGATTAGASPNVAAGVGALAGGAEGLTGAGQAAGAAAAGDSAAVGNGEFGTTFGGTSGSTGTGSSIQGIGGGGGGNGGGSAPLDTTGAFDQNASQGVFDSSGNPLNQQEPGMWDWLDSMDSGDNSFDFGNFGVDQGSSSAGTASNAADETGAFDQSGSLSGPNSDTSIFGGSADNPFGNMSLTDIISKYGSQGLSAVKSLIAKASGGGTQSTGGGILGNILSNPLGAAFDSTPFLLALNEANKQSGDLNSVLNGINGTGYTKAVLDPYDTDTGTGRAALQNDMALRGVAGSSFGDTQLNNYDYTRALGRSDMASKAQLATAQLQGNLINQRNTNRNLLLGAGLNASGKLFSPQPDPFNLKALLGA